MKSRTVNHRVYDPQLPCWAKSNNFALTWTALLFSNHYTDLSFLSLRQGGGLGGIMLARRNTYCLHSFSALPSTDLALRQRSQGATLQIWKLIRMRKISQVSAKPRRVCWRWQFTQRAPQPAVKQNLAESARRQQEMRSSYWVQAAGKIDILRMMQLIL